MERQGYTSVSQMRGSMSQQSVRDSTVYVRGNYMQGPPELHQDDGRNTRHWKGLRHCQNPFV